MLVSPSIPLAALPPLVWCSGSSIPLEIISSERALTALLGCSVGDGGIGGVISRWVMGGKAAALASIWVLFLVRYNLISGFLRLLFSVVGFSCWDFVTFCCFCFVLGVLFLLSFSLVVVVFVFVFV